MEPKINSKIIETAKNLKYNWHNLGWFITIFTILIIPIILSEIFDIYIVIPDSNFHITYFSTISALYFIGKMLFSFFNYLKNNSIETYELKNKPSIGVQITGWKEDKELFKNTLIGIKYQTYKNIKKVTFCSDGNDDDDLYMGDIFKEVFPNNSIIYKMEKTYHSMNKEEREELVDNVKDYKYICLLQPHAGKRHGMYVQMKLLTHKKMKVDCLQLVDSDCIYELNAIEYMVKTMEYRKADVVTGDVKIYNIDNLLALLISLKFWYAFNLERAAQSFFGIVGCVPGPFGLYKRKTIKPLIDVWIEQKLLGKECTFGDDRHLTNLVLANYGKVCYDHRAKCYTDTPTSIQRFATQQTRWGKSFLREYFYNIKSFRLNTVWLSFEQTFVFFIVYYVMYYLTLNFYSSNLQNILLLFSSLMSFGFLRSLYAIICTKGDFSFLIFPLYSYLYLFILFPVKLWTLFTFNVTSWGTGSRLVKSFKLIDFSFIIIWTIFILGCVVYSFYVQYQESFELIHIILFSYIVFTNIFCYCLYKFYYKKKVQDDFDKILEKIVRFEKKEEKIEIKIDDQKEKSLESYKIEMDDIEEMNLELQYP